MTRFAPLQDEEIAANALASSRHSCAESQGFLRENDEQSSSATVSSTSIVTPAQTNEIKLTQIRPHAGSQRTGFEEMTYQLFASEYGTAAATQAWKASIEDDRRRVIIGHQAKLAIWLTITTSTTVVAYGTLQVPARCLAYAIFSTHVFRKARLL